MTRRQRLTLALVAVAALLLVACGSDKKSATTAAPTTATNASGPATTSAAAAATTAAGSTAASTSATTGAATGAPTKPTAAPAAAKPLKWVLLIGGPSTDGGFYQAMVDGLKDAAKIDGKIDVTVRDNLSTGGDASEENAVRDAASSGDFDLIIAHGFDLVPSVAKFAPEFPKQLFATSLPVEGNPPNVEVYLSVFEEIGYNAGFLAAQGTTAGKIGFIGGPGADFEKQAEAGFRQAVSEYAPNAAVTAVYTGTFEDPQLAQEATKQMIDSGIDSIWNQQAAGQSGVYTACAAAPKVHCFGNSQYSEAVNPGAVIASSVSNNTILVPLWAQRERAGTWAIGPDMLSIANTGTTITGATAAGKAALPGLQASIDAYLAKAATGAIKVNPAPQSSVPATTTQGT
jgi:basic membrane protein A